MRTTNSFYYMLLILVLTMGMMYCGNDGSGTENGNEPDSSVTMQSDSAMNAHNRDPSTAYPAPPVTGSNQDSSRTKDSANKQ